MMSASLLRAVAVVFASLAVCLPAVAVDNVDRDGVGSGNPISVETATAVAVRHVQLFGPAANFTVGEARPVRNLENEAVLYYCVDLNPTGYVIVSGATNLPPVVAYSFTGAAGNAEPGNPLADLLQLDLGRRVENACLIPAAEIQRCRARWADYLDPAAGAELARGFQQWPPAGSTPTGGWILTNWDQGSPYNTLCPLDSSSGQHSYAGCPAVAMAQILNYHKRLNGTQFNDGDDYYHSYDGNNYWIDNNWATWGFPSFPQLNNYLATLFSNYFNGTPVSSTTRAALIFACGVAAQQVYSDLGSGTFGVSQAMDAYTKFGCDTAELLVASSPGVYTRLAQNMMSAFPAHLAIVNPSWTSGHNVVVDGYNTNNYYHLNFGWSGSYNGWYLVPSGLPFSLTVLEGVIVDIMIDDCEPMDCDCNGIVNMQDFTYLRTCLAGPVMPGGHPGCTAFDGDGDADTDLHDFAAFQATFGS
jgi:hypothetical protein